MGVAEETLTSMGKDQIETCMLEIQATVDKTDGKQNADFLAVFDKPQLKALTPRHAKLGSTISDARAIAAHVVDPCELDAVVSAATELSYKAAALSVKWGIYSLERKAASGEDVRQQYANLFGEHLQAIRHAYHIDLKCLGLVSPVIR